MIIQRVILTNLLTLLLYGVVQSQPQTEINVGIFPRHNFAETIRMYLPMSKYLSQHLGLQVKFNTTKNFTEFWQNVAENKYDLVHLNQYQYITAQKQFGYKLLLMNEEFGEATLKSVIITRKDSGINTLQDLRNKTVIFGDSKSAMMSYLIPRSMLRDAGLSEASYKSTFARNPPNALMAVYLNRADACGIGDAVLKLKKIQQRIKSNQLQVIATSNAVPHLAWASSPLLSSALQDKIKKLLIDLKSTTEGKAILEQAGLTALRAAQHADYIPLEKYMEVTK